MLNCPACGVQVEEEEWCKVCGVCKLCCGCGGKIEIVNVAF